MSFSVLGLSPKVLSAIEAAGYTSPTPIQAQAIPSAVAGKDVLGIAQTGTGKTASFVLPMLTRLEQGRARARMPRSLILCPTRELAAQVAENFDRYGVNHKLNMALLIGGVSFDDQNRKLDRGADVLIATPGRLLDHFQRGKLLMTGVEILVIDEADRMLDMGFIPDIERICSLLPPNRQTLFFSATMPPEIQRLVNSFLKNPTRVEVAPQATTAATITQRFKWVEGADWDKREALRELIRTSDVKNAIIFCNRKRDVDVLHKSLVKHGFDAGCLHGDLDQHTRTQTLDAFRSGNIKLLVASDVAARGLDIPDVSHIFNFDVPIHAEDYVHRIGRTGRAGKLGASFTLVSDGDMRTLGEIEKMVSATLEWIGEPPPADAGTRRKRRGPPSAGRGEGGRGERRGRPQRGTGRERGPRPERDHHRDPHRERVAADEAIAAPPIMPAAETAGGPAPTEREPRRPASEHRSTRQREPRREHTEPRPDTQGSPAERPDAQREDRRTARPRHERLTETTAEPAGRPGRQRRGGGGRNANDEGPQVVGLGDHMPDFLKRPIKQPGS